MGDERANARRRRCPALQPHVCAALFAIALIAALCPSAAWADDPGFSNAPEAADVGLAADGSAMGGLLDAGLVAADSAAIDDPGQAPARDGAIADPVDAGDGDDGDAQEPAMQPVGVPMYRLYNPNSGEHFYTADASERNGLVDVGWADEGIGWVASDQGDDVYRLYNPYAGDHHYTQSAEERDALVDVGWAYEGVGWSSGGDLDILRQYNPNAAAGAHNFTSSQEENDALVSVGWMAEGAAWRALAATMEAFAGSYGMPHALLSVEGGDLQVDASLIDGWYYLFLPSFADVGDLRLRATLDGEDVALQVAAAGSSQFSDLEEGSSLDVDALAAETADNGARLLWFRYAGSSVIQRLAVMVSQGVSSVHLRSVVAEQGRAYVEASPNHSVKADVLVTVVDAQGALVYGEDAGQNASTVKGRGNTTWKNKVKKPYQITLSKKADLLQTGQKDNAQKKWILLANANDATLLHNAIAFDLGLELGMTGTECLPVDLYYDGEYRGSYLLSEKVEVKKGRVDIFDLEGAFEDANPGVDFDGLSMRLGVNAYGKLYRYAEGLADPQDLTGGYLLEVDEAYYRREPCWFDSSWGHVVVKSPEYCSQAAMRYISEFFETALRNLDRGITAEGGPRVDVDTLAKTYLVNEFFKNVDAFNSSTYLYKDAESEVLTVAPLWDFDSSMGTRNDVNGTPFLTYHGFMLPWVSESNVFKEVSSVPLVATRDAIVALWDDALRQLLSSVLLSDDPEARGPRGRLHSIDWYRGRIAASQRMDEALFGLMSSSNNLRPLATYELTYQRLKTWIADRVAWMDGNIGRVRGSGIDNAPCVYDEVDYGLVYDASYYRQMNPDLAGIDEVHLLQHFVQFGMSEGRLSCRNFDVGAYRAHNADLDEAFGDDLRAYYLHYLQHGFYEGRVAL